MSASGFFAPGAAKRLEDAMPEAARLGACEEDAAAPCEEDAAARVGACEEDAEPEAADNLRAVF